MKKEVLRQLIHASGVFIVIFSYFLKPDALILLSVALVVFISIIFQIDKKQHIPFFSTILRSCRRQDDEIGFILFFIGITLTLIIFQFNMAVANAAILILLFGDSASTIVGQKWGKTKLPLKKKKTLEGSLAFLAVGLLVALTQLPLIPAFLGAFSGALTEAYSPVDDNISVPLVAGLVMSLIIYCV